MHQEVALTSIFGNTFRISAPTIKNEDKQTPDEVILLKFEEKGIMIQKEDIYKLKQFLDELTAMK